jgi:hypothetical protein
MKRNQEQEWDGLASKSLEAQLRHLRQVDVPETLEAKLLAALPTEGAETFVEYRAKPNLRLWDFWVTAAAAILILALMLTANYGLSTPSQMLSTRLKDASLRHTAWDRDGFLGDHNTLAEDINYATCKW